MHRIITKTVAVFAIAASAIVAAPAAQAGETVNGKGSSFANNFMQKCAKEFNAKTGNTVAYTATGSGAGLTAYKSGAMDSQLPIHHGLLELHQLQHLLMFQ